MAHTCRVLTGERAAGAFGDEWDKVAFRNPYATVFQTSGWYRAWLESGAEIVEPIVLEISDRGELTAGMALQISGLTDVLSIRALSTPWADYHEGIGQPDDADSQLALGEALLDLAKTRGLPVDIDDVVGDGFLARSLATCPGSLEPSTFVGAMTLTNAEHVERVLRRREHRVKWRRIRRQGAVRCRFHSETKAIRSRLPVFIDMHRRQWSDRKDVVAPFDGVVVDRAFDAMVRHLGPRGAVMLVELTLNDAPVAMYFGFVFRRTFAGYRTAYDLAFRRYSPGHLMLQHMILDLPQMGIDTLDFMRGDYTYKLGYVNRRGRNIRFLMGPP